jgi:dolichol-phosphate mannosyltransferase
VRVLGIAQAVAAAPVARRLARGRVREPPLAAPATAPATTISVVIPARNEAERIRPCLEALARDADLLEVIVVDDRSGDATAQVAERLGARVVAGRELPAGWVGKPWALQQGLEAAKGDVVVCLDADTRPRPGLARALAAVLDDGADFVTAGARFVCDTPGERLAHPSLLASLVYRYGPQDTLPPPPPDRRLANGQCTAARRTRLLEAGGYAPAAPHLTDDAAQARALARAGWSVAFRDGAQLVEVRMHASLGELWREWGRTIALTDVTAPTARAVDLATVWLVMALPVARALAGRPTRLDLALLAVRAALTGALAGTYARRGLPFWLSPLADPATAVRLTLSTLRPARAWRGRTYAPAARPPRTARR